MDRGGRLHLLYFAFVLSSRKHRENVFIWCIYLTRLVLVLMHPPRSIAFGIIRVRVLVINNSDGTLVLQSVLVLVHTVALF